MTARSIIEAAVLNPNPTTTGTTPRSFAIMIDAPNLTIMIVDGGSILEGPFCIMGTGTEHRIFSIAQTIAMSLSDEWTVRLNIGLDGR